MAVVFVSLASKGNFYIAQDGLHYDMEDRVVEDLGKLHIDRPSDVFIVPSLQNYALLPYLPDVGPTYESWKDRCRQLLAKCDEVIVLNYAGWKNSVGVVDEIWYAEELGIPVTYIKSE